MRARTRRRSDGDGDSEACSLPFLVSVVWRLMAGVSRLRMRRMGLVGLRVWVWWCLSGCRMLGVMVTRCWLLCGVAL